MIRSEILSCQSMCERVKPNRCLLDNRIDSIVNTIRIAHEHDCEWVVFCFNSNKSKKWSVIERLFDIQWTISNRRHH